jgi:hypothetical protein
MWITSQSQLIFDKSVYDLCLCKEMLFFHKQTKEKLMFIIQLVTEIATNKQDLSSKFDPLK